MAVTTTTTQTDKILAELIAARSLSASYPTLVASKHVNYDMDSVGAPAFAKAYPRLADDGAAAALTEGTDLSTVTTASMGTQLVLTPAEVGMRFDLTDRVARRRMPGIATVHEAIDAGNIPVLLSIFEEEVMRLRKACFEKLEVDIVALFDDFSTTVGTSGSNLTVAQTETAIYQLTKKETGAVDRWRFFLDPIQLSDVRQEIAVTSGGLGGGVWSGDIQSIMTVKAGLSVDGLQGTLWGVPVYVLSNSVNPHPNSAADEAGCLMVAGYGHPEGDQPGAVACLFGQEFHVRFDGDASKRETEIIGIMEYAVGERADDMGISIITDA